ncbi:winged helix DNA-binding protein [Aquamicrobium soli]|jgi:predicted MarR family transcription regulator|uniref:Winged helix DNA-binding protein n=1 Tax=Aquamicrobium soli TaxID=1811518 RepID=A0ABV7KG44_9HYPH
MKFGGDAEGSKAAQADAPARRSRPVVSSEHLAAGGSPALSEIEYGLIVAHHAFSRWMSRGMAAAGVSGMQPTEVMILHTVRHRDRPKRFADICLVLGMEDMHVVTYAVRKLERAGLVEVGRQGKEKLVSATRAGVEVCARYAELREQLLVTGTTSAGYEEQNLSEIAAVLRALSGYYDQAARSAAALA